MSVPTLTNMATAPAMPPPAAFEAAFFKTTESGFFSASAACARKAGTHSQGEAARRLCARTDGLMKTLCRVGPYTEVKPGKSIAALDFTPQTQETVAFVDKHSTQRAVPERRGACIWKATI
tara:strand:+ start:98 stop:460 length:363 start_codon:yes stop_codon:yes gene_type:complete